MVTLKSNNEPYWICGAMIFSGRRDPTWLLNEEQVKNIIDIWNSLPVSEKHLTIPGFLGYKGCYLISSSNDKWHSFRRIVTLIRQNTIAESRKDEIRKFENALLETAPEDAIPKAMLIEEFK
jgi:hypothetical protein